MPPLQNRPPPLEQVRCSDATFVPSQLVARNDAEWLGDAFLETSHIAIRKDAEAVLRLMNSAGRLVFLRKDAKNRWMHLRYLLNTSLPDVVSATARGQKAVHFR